MSPDATPSHFVFDDGGRAAAGYKGSANDCICRSIAIAADRPYQSVYDDLNLLGKLERPSKRYRKAQGSARTGVRIETVQSYLASIGWIWHPTMKIGSGCTVHLRREELPLGRLIVRLSGHLVAVIDGVIHDTGDPARGGSRCVYGYWQLS